MKLFERSCSELNRVTGLTVTFPAKLHAALDYSNGIGDFLQYLLFYSYRAKASENSSSYWKFLLLLHSESGFHCTSILIHSRVGVDPDENQEDRIFEVSAVVSTIDKSFF